MLLSVWLRADKGVVFIIGVNLFRLGSPDSLTDTQHPPCFFLWFFISLIIFIFSGEGALILSLTNNTHFDFGKKKICNILIKAKPGETNSSKIVDELNTCPSGSHSHILSASNIRLSHVLSCKIFPRKAPILKFWSQLQKWKISCFPHPAKCINFFTNRAVVNKIEIQRWTARLNLSCRIY